MRNPTSAEHKIGPAAELVGEHDPLREGAGTDVVPASTPTSSRRALRIVEGPRASPSLLEHWFPFRALSQIAKADKRAKDPAYTAHRWWARRPPGVLRGVLLGLSLDPSTSADEFWAAFNRDTEHLRGTAVLDLFAGGGTTLVEATRLGARPMGVDVDPLAVSIVQHELERPSTKVINAAATELLTHLHSEVGFLFKPSSRAWMPLHYFYLHRVTCPHCGAADHLYKDLVVARDIGKHGAVVRDASVYAFCPDCLSIHAMHSATRVELRCCGRRRNIADGTFKAQRYHCGTCKGKATHRDLRTGACPRTLLAVEETTDDDYRRIRAPNAQDAAQTDAAENFVSKQRGRLFIPNGALHQPRTDARPVSFGISEYAQFFSPRQLAVFGLAFAWVRAATIPNSIKRALMLALSNALSTNNKLCGYATDYGRLAPLFSVRSYSLPALAVELNPLHPSAGRGTLTRSFEKIQRSCGDKVRRYTWSIQRKKPEAAIMTFPARAPGESVVCGSAASLPAQGTKADLCVFDPPYFDYIAYSELSEFYRAWHESGGLGGVPLHPSSDDPINTFATGLGACLAAGIRRLKPGKPMAFTYHASSKAAWEAVGLALDRVDLLITALWPVRNDSHMGHHTEAGNLEWDLIVVCRLAKECQRAPCSLDVKDWVTDAKPLKISTADRAALQLAIDMAARRFGRPIGYAPKPQSHRTREGQ